MTTTANTLSGKERKYLRGLAHDLRPVAHVGRDGLTPAVLESIDEALSAHELIKVRFVDHKEEKRALVAELEERLRCAKAGIIGHVAILYRQAREPDRRRIELPGR